MAKGGRLRKNVVLYGKKSESLDKCENWYPRMYLVLKVHSVKENFISSSFGSLDGRKNTSNILNGICLPLDNATARKN